MEHGFYYSYIKTYYSMGLYTEKDLDLFVSVQWLTDEEKKSIINS